MKFASEYKNNPVQFPGRDINPELKKKAPYCKLMASAIYSAYVGDKTLASYSSLSRYDEIRRYANGNQDPLKYEKLLYGTDLPSIGVPVSDTDTALFSANEKRKGTGNLNKEILSMAPRIMQAILGSFKDVDYNLVADTIDPDSGYEQSFAKSKLFVEGKELEFLNALREASGLEPENDSKYPKDLDELQLMEDLGEFKTGISKALEKLLKHTYDISDWEGTKEKLIRDIVNFNSICLHDYYDQEEKKWKTCYEDITRVTAQYSDKRDYNDSGFYGIIKEKSIVDIRHNLESEGYSNEEINSIAYSWSGELGNPFADQWGAYKGIKEGGWACDFYKCLVYEVEWFDNDKEYKSEYISSTGFRTIKDQPYGVIKNDKRVKPRITSFIRKYQTSWIVGTNLLYNYGLAPSQPRTKSNKRPLSSYHIYCGSEIAITQRLIPIFDQFQIAWLKLQDGLTKSWPEMMLIDLTVLDRIKMGGRDYKPEDIVKLAKKTGAFFHRSLPMNGKYPGGNVKPIDKIPSTVMNQIDDTIKLFDNCIRTVELVTGINAIALGQQPNGQTGLGEAEIAMQNTTKILRPIIDSIFKVKQQSAEYLSEAIRLGIRNDEECRSAYIKVVGENDVNALYKSNFEARELGITLVPRPTTEELMSLYEDIRTYSLPGKNGDPLLRPDVQMYVKEKLRRGANISDIRLFISVSINKELARQEKSRNEGIQLQGQQNTQLEQAKGQNAMQLEDMRFKQQQALSRQQYEEDFDIQELKQFGDREKLGAEMDMREKELQSQQTQTENA